MSNQATLKKGVDNFIKDIENGKTAASTAASKKRHLTVFLSFLEESKQDNLPLASFTKKQYQQFSVFLNKMNIKVSTKRSYLATVLGALKRLEVPDFVKEEETDLQKIINSYFATKGYSLQEIKDNCKKRKIIYSRYTRAGRDLLDLAGSVYKAKRAIEIVSQWAKSRNLDYSLETVIKKWPEISKLKPKEKKKKSYYRGDPMMWVESKKKWFVINSSGDWLEFAGDKNDIEWREE